ncbi:MAG: winged helix-turn-helix transcriptional regulator [Clostridia bacterium]|nr:winged helix-turn-helix transcriptional regulator [Clostridia bacterium]
MCQKDVERQINLRPSSVSTLISNLEKDGFLKRTVSEGDARSKYLELTEKGRYICIKEKLFMDSCDSAIQNALSPQEQEELEKLLQKIIDSISN